MEKGRVMRFLGGSQRIMAPMSSTCVGLGVVLGGEVCGTDVMDMEPPWARVSLIKAW